MKIEVSKNKVSGFTLIEIVIVIAIVGILSALAIPAYQASALRSNRADGKTALLQIAAAQESFYSANNSYSTVANPLSNTNPFTSADGKYIITVAACDGGAIGNCFLATATPQGGQAEDECENLTLSNIGARGSSEGNAADCWSR